MLSWSHSQQSTISGIPIDTYDPYAAVSCQLVKVQSIPSCAKHWTDKEHGWKADVVEIRRRRIYDLKLWMVCSPRKPQSLVKVLRACYADCLVLWWEGCHRWRNTMLLPQEKRKWAELGREQDTAFSWRFAKRGRALARLCWSCLGTLGFTSGNFQKNINKSEIFFFFWDNPRTTPFYKLQLISINSSDS